MCPTQRAVLLGARNDRQHLGLLLRLRRHVLLEESDMLCSSGTTGARLRSTLKETQASPLAT